MGQRTYLDIFPSGTTRERGNPLTPRARPPLLGQPEPPAKNSGLSRSGEFWTGVETKSQVVYLLALVRTRRQACIPRIKARCFCEQPGHSFILQQTRLVNIVVGQRVSTGSMQQRLNNKRLMERYSTGTPAAFAASIPYCIPLVIPRSV